MRRHRADPIDNGDEDNHVRAERCQQCGNPVDYDTPLLTESISWKGSRHFVYCLLAIPGATTRASVLISLIRQKLRRHAGSERGRDIFARIYLLVLAKEHLFSLYKNIIKIHQRGQLG